jgi:UDP-N-acetylglucosamine 2-epimerase (non-hydrolysing)
MDEHSDFKEIYSIHMNTVDRHETTEELGDCDRIHIIEPLAVLDFYNFFSRCYLGLTDGSGVQEKDPSLCKSVLVTRDITKRPRESRW